MEHWQSSFHLVMGWLFIYDVGNNNFSLKKNNILSRTVLTRHTEQMTTVNVDPVDFQSARNFFNINILY